ncbi:MAG: winged helix-turn-helix transcriptional regulator, partial [Planctomycetes bacterium]|nr:winged helix-turn-helix transcriptional regulator [Planctomycetota bacterium]
EYALLEYLIHRRDELVTRADIRTHVYSDAPNTSNVIDVYIGYLRKRLEREGQPRLIHTRRGAGYIFGIRE